MPPHEILSASYTSSVSSWSSILVLVLFILTNVLVIYPVHLLRLPLNLHTAPLIALLILIAAAAIDGPTIRAGILGSGGVQPIDVMALFISLAYLSISLDTTGLFRYLALKVAQRSKSGLRLYVYLYLFWLVIAGIVGNDPVILSGTAFLAYFTRVAGITPPTAWIYAQFVAANMASLPLPPSNPTNLVLTSTFGLPFLTYTAHVIVPFLISALCVGAALVVRFKYWEESRFANRWRVSAPYQRRENLMLMVSRGQEKRSRHRTESSPTSELEHEDHPSHPLIPKTISLSSSPSDDVDPSTLLVSPLSAIVGSILLLTALVLLVATSSIPSLSGKAPVWEITVPAAGGMVGWDLGGDLWRLKWKKAGAREPTQGREVEGNNADRVGDGREGHDGGEDIEMLSRSAEDASSSSRSPTLRSSPPSPAIPSTFNPPKPDPALPIHVQRFLHTRITHLTRLYGSVKEKYAKITGTTKEHLPTLTTVVGRMPWPLVPFAFEMFILTHTLSTHAWVPLFGRWWAAYLRLSARGGKVAGIVGAVGGMGVVGAVGCNICGTNIGATILLSQVLQASFEVKYSDWAVTPAQKQASIYALAISSNYGAFTQCFCASLAGLLWVGILRGKGIIVKQRQFAETNLPVVFVAMLVACAVLVAEIYVLYPDG
ncbi:hypothetical protein OE88DRAFT_1725986 [Heliocybe sulcata]|uniref:Citrate transporter-like domain-containing protein n=1 Tax=Heliocybe sulcata TaxID=5364 RepID=A0A5C3N3Z2_9AGAM|nr:hypothetical protein OE88DRAFT_1725986 [Heliocybe sulcata]